MDIHIVELLFVIEILGGNGCIDVVFFETGRLVLEKSAWLQCVSFVRSLTFPRLLLGRALLFFFFFLAWSNSMGNSSGDCKMGLFGAESGLSSGVSGK